MAGYEKAASQANRAGHEIAPSEPHNPLAKRSAIGCVQRDLDLARDGSSKIRRRNKFRINNQVFHVLRHLASNHIPVSHEPVLIYRELNDYLITRKRGAAQDYTRSLARGSLYAAVGQRDNLNQRVEAALPRRAKRREEQPRNGHGRKQAAGKSQRRGPNEILQPEPRPMAPTSQSADPGRLRDLPGGLARRHEAQFTAEAPRHRGSFDSAQHCTQILEGLQVFGTTSATLKVSKYGIAFASGNSAVHQQRNCSSCIVTTHGLHSGAEAP